MSKTVGEFYNEEVERLRDKQKTADEITLSNERLAAMNDSYRKRYAKYVQILMVLVFAYAIYLAVVLLQKQFPAIPQFVVDLIMVVLILLVALYLFNSAWELYNRSLINYDELDLPKYDASGADLTELAKKGQVIDGVNATATGAPCVGVGCCPTGKIIDSNTGKCESFTTLEYSNIESAYTNNLISGSTFKREPNANDVAPTQDGSALSYSTV
jgi:hypothetical protein